MTNTYEYLDNAQRRAAEEREMGEFLREGPLPATAAAHQRQALSIDAANRRANHAAIAALETLDRLEARHQPEPNRSPELAHMRHYVRVLHEAADSLAAFARFSVQLELVRDVSLHRQALALKEATPPMPPARPLAAQLKAKAADRILRRYPATPAMAPEQER